MIVKMKKITILVSNRNKETSLKELQKAGLVHIKNINKPLNEDINKLENDIESAERALNVIEDTENEKASLSYTDIENVVKEINQIHGQKENISNKREDLKRKADWYKKWDNFSLEEVEDLKKENIYLKFYICSKKDLKGIGKDKLVQIVNQVGSTIYLVFITRDKEQDLSLKKIALPGESLSSVRDKIGKLSNKLKELDNRFKELSRFRDDILNFKEQALKKLEFSKVNAGMAAEEGFSYLQGFCPYDSVKEIKKLSQLNGWGIIVEDPQNLQEPPTLLRNPKWIEIIKPVFNFMGTLPGYNEYDVSFWFLMFFSIFFALLVGDAGYGFLFLAATYFFSRKVKKPNAKKPFFLMYVLSVSTIAWGVVTGTYFGYEQFAQIPFLNSLIIKRIDSFAQGNQNFIMYLCFIIGAVQLTIGHLIRAYRYINSLFALSQLGWISIIWGLFCVVRFLLVGMPLFDYTGHLIGAGSVLVIFFSKPDKNIFKAAAFGLSDLPLTAINSFSDIVSYVRLFAVGYATVAVASSFNEMALSIGFDNIFKGLMGAMVLFLGHSLNILLALMAVIVHGIRLNMLEFSNHLDMEWSGHEYKPFTK